MGGGFRADSSRNPVLGILSRKKASKMGEAKERYGEVPQNQPRGLPESGGRRKDREKRTE